MTYFCPCIVFGQAAEKIGESCCKCGCCLLIPIANIIAFTRVRGAIREKHGIEGSCCKDFLCLLVCGFCTMFQTAKEVEDDAAPGDGQAMARS